MQHRNVLSLFFPKIRSFISVFICASFATLTAPAFADSSDDFPILSLFKRSAEPIENPLGDPEEALSVYVLGDMPVFKGAIDLTEQPEDLWIRIRNGFAMTNLNDDLTLHYQQYYQNRPEALRRMVERSRPYLHHIVEEIESRGMPTELALLPMVESSFNPMAYSRAHASGLWQFIPATGKRFNLEQSWWRDQRRDIVASTSAALDYLQTIYNMHGDWHLALASYNWGEGSVKRAIEKNVSRDMPTDYASLTMPNETRHYVPKLQALKNIFGNPTLMAQLNLPQISNRPYFAMIETSQPMDVKMAARLANMPVDQFVALNPSHNRPIMKADTPVIIPADKLETFQSNLLANSAPLSEWQAYTPRTGEKLDKIAPRFGIALSDLRRINGLHGKLAVANATLLVPAGHGNSELAMLQNTPSLPQIVEPEPAKKSTKNTSRAEKPGKSGKHAKDSGKNTAKGKNTGKEKNSKADGKKPAGKSVAKTSPKQAKEKTSSSNAKPAKTSGKAAASTKTVKSGKPHRG